MFTLSFPGVRYCMEALRTPRHQEDAIRAIARAGEIRQSTAYDYLRLARRLGLVVDDAQGRCALAAAVERPEELLEASTLIRLFHARHRLGAPLLPVLDLDENPLEPFGFVTPTVLSSADALARRLQGIGEELPPQAALILELARLWSEAHAGLAHAPPLHAGTAFRMLEQLSVAPEGGERGRVEAFVRACMFLYGRQLVVLNLAQYAADVNRRFARFRTTLGHIKGIHSPAPHRGPGYTGPLDAPQRLVSTG